jgi:hypothetical protein
MASADGTRGRSKLSRIVSRQVAETPQLDETTATSSLRNSTPDRSEAEIREDAADIHGRFLRAEAWLECHDEAHPRWSDALDRMNAAILGMVGIEQEARQRGIENIFGNLSKTD